MERLLLGIVTAGLAAIIIVRFLFNIFRAGENPKGSHGRTFYSDLSRLILAVLKWRSQGKKDSIIIEYLENRFENKLNGYESSRLREQFPPDKIMAMSKKDLRVLHRQALEKARL